MPLVLGFGRTQNIKAFCQSQNCMSYNWAWKQLSVRSRTIEMVMR